MSDRKNVMGGAWPMLWHWPETNAQIHVHEYLQTKQKDYKILKTI
jgi:hypothetical protein